MATPDFNGTPTPFKDSAGRGVCVGDPLADGKGHHFRIDRYGRLVDVVGRRVEGIRIADLTVTYIERAGTQRRLIPVRREKPD